jgi:CheY-like chemotaxis protein
MRPLSPASSDVATRRARLKEHLDSADGFALLRQLRGDHDPTIRCLPVVAITAHAHPKDREQCLASGFDAYESKPLDMNHITALVAGLVSRRREIEQ